MNKTLIVGICLLLTGCGDNPMGDNRSIKDTNYAMIRLEMQRCSHFEEEGGVHSLFRFYPRTDCLKHLQTRIVVTGKAKNNLLSGDDD